MVVVFTAAVFCLSVASGVEPNKTETANKCIALLEHLQNAVAREGLISKNEGCNDISTADLGLLVIEYMLGNLLLKLPFSHSNPAGRRSTIDRADALFNEYLGRCHRCYELVHFQRSSNNPPSSFVFDPPLPNILYLCAAALISVGVLSPSVYAEFEDEVEGRCNYSPAEVRRR